MTLELVAPAKLNLTLEVLGKRDDGYHEIVSIMQTIDLVDHVRLSEADSIQLVVSGAEAKGVPEDPARNLAYRAAVALAAEAGRSDLGARIELEKRIPAGMGLGGGSSDAAAVLRGLNQLWGLDFEIERLERVAAALGSDVPFFLHGGTAIASGRGELVEALPDIAPFDLTLFLPSVEIEDKTRRMYSLITPADYKDGMGTLLQALALGSRLASSRFEKVLVDASSILSATDIEPSDLELIMGEAGHNNVFDRHISDVASGVAPILARCREIGLDVTLTGSGPAFFTRRPPYEVPRHLYLDLGAANVTVVGCRTLSRAEATAVREV